MRDGTLWSPSTIVPLVKRLSPPRYCVVYLSTANPSPKHSGLTRVSAYIITTPTVQHRFSRITYASSRLQLIIATRHRGIDGGVAALSHAFATESGMWSRAGIAQVFL